MSDSEISRVFHDGSFNVEYEKNLTLDGYLPDEVTFNSDSLVSVVSYSVLFVLGSIGNVSGNF